MGAWGKLPPLVKAIVVAGVILVALAVVTSLGGSKDAAPVESTTTGTPAPTTTTTEAPTTTADPREESSLACDHFRNIMGDVRDGLLTDAELRDKLKEVHDDAVIGTDAVQLASTHLLAAATSGSGVLDAAAEMSTACKAAGH